MARCFLAAVFPNPTRRDLDSGMWCVEWIPTSPLSRLFGQSIRLLTGTPAMCHWNQEDTLGSEGRFLL